MARRKKTEVTSVPVGYQGGLPVVQTIGGPIEGASRFDRETAMWNPSRLSPDRIINSVKDTADARGRDVIRNNGYVSGAAGTHRDSIIGSQYRLTANPNLAFLRTLKKSFDDTWVEEFQEVVEARFQLLSDSTDHWLDAEGKNTLTSMLRLIIGVFLATGETIATCEWIRQKDRPYNTAIQMIRSDRLSNPNGVADSEYLRRGVQTDIRGQPINYYIRTTDSPWLAYTGEKVQWVAVPAYKPWGRKQVIHILEQQDHGQSRGIADMVSVLKGLRMTKRYSEVVLQSAVINATYAAAIESELPSEAIVAAMGGGASSDPATGMLSVYNAFLTALSGYLGGSNNIGIDGAMIPHLFPGTKLSMKNAGTPGGVGTEFEASMLRYIASGLGVSYEALSRDYSKTNYSSGKLANNQMGQAMAARKKHVADRFASDVYLLVLEEMLANGDAPLPAGVRRDVFYQPLAKDAFGRCEWIGSGAGQVDEIKESQAAILRIQGGLSTHQIECARLGYDYREVIKQQGRELKLWQAAGVSPTYTTIKPNGQNDNADMGGDPTGNQTGANQ